VRACRQRPAAGNMAAVGLMNTLPAPKREYAAPEPAPAPQPAPGPSGPCITREAPPYGTAERNHYIPRRPSDFGDGGAFPEVQAAASMFGMLRDTCMLCHTLVYASLCCAA
jgi:SNW domain-containing protein 1